MRQARGLVPRDVPPAVHRRVELQDQPARRRQRRWLHRREDGRLGRFEFEHRIVQAALGLIKTLRPHQWVKNLLFVSAALVFSRHLTDPPYVLRTALAVLAFCMLSGAVYAFNDVRDVDSDRVHPTKRNRPIAAGVLSERTALIWAGILAAAALAGCLALSWKLAVV